MTYKVVLADDHPIFREGLIRSLEETGEFKVVGSGGTAQEAIDLVDKHKPDLVLLDISMPDGGLFAVREIKKLDNIPYIAILTVSEDDDDVTTALQEGALGYVLKGTSAANLRTALTQVAEGNPYISPALAVNVLLATKQIKNLALKNQYFNKLTSREEAVLRHISKGLSNKEVSEKLHLQERTVKHYMTSIMKKLGVKNRVEAALIAAKVWDQD